jgi:UDP-N-acetylmuramoyl-L-alanyl-D-glutamate--2,6-diaminopimelate ligase
MAKKDDTVVLTGKGHETCQVIGKEKFHFSEREIVEEELKRLGYVYDRAKV